MNQSILRWVTDPQGNDQMKALLSLVGFDVRDVDDEMEAINVIGLSRMTAEEYTCFMICLSRNMSRLPEVFAYMDGVGFDLPILLVVPDAETMSIRKIQDRVPAGLNVHFCYENSTMDALTLLNNDRKG